MSAQPLARDAVRALPLYAPDLAECAVDVSDNTNLWGAPPAVLCVLRRWLSSAPPGFPSVYSTPLRAAILRYTQLDGIQGTGVVTGCGSDDVIDATMRAFGTAGAASAHCAPASPL